MVKKVMEPDADLSGDEEASRDGDREPDTTPPVDSLIQVDIETGRGTKNTQKRFIVRSKNMNPVVQLF